MNLLEVVRQVRGHLEESGRVSYRMLSRQFDLDHETGAYPQSRPAVLSPASLVLIGD